MPRILITRSPHQSSELADRLRAFGADTILIPTIDIVEPTTFAPLDAALASLRQFNWLIFTSANAVATFDRRIRLQPEPLSIPPAAAIGSATARALEKIGIVPALVPPQAVAESLTESLLPLARRPDGTPTRFLLVRAESSGDTPPRDLLPDALRDAGAEVTIAAAYRTIVPRASIEAIRTLFATLETTPDAITFTSSSTARNFFTLLAAAGIPSLIHPPVITPAAQRDAETRNPPNRIPQDTPILASIGPITSATLRDLGHPPHVEAPEATVASLAEILVKHLTAGKPTQRQQSKAQSS